MICKLVRETALVLYRYSLEGGGVIHSYLVKVGYVCYNQLYVVGSCMWFWSHIMAIAG